MEQKKEFDDLIIRHLINETTPDEEVKLQQWLGESDGHRKYYEQTERLWELAGVYQPAFAENRESDLKHIEERLTHYPAPRIASFNRFYRMAAAAAAVLVFAMGVFYLINSRQAASSQKMSFLSADNIVHQILPDGSEIWLNRNSSLTFQYTKEKNRTCILNGEAFFQVMHDSLHPFEIVTPSALIRVLGTSFNVKTDSRSNETEVLVSEGKVSLTPAKSNVQAVILPSGAFAKANAHSVIDRKEKFSRMNYLSWKTRILVFRDTPLDSALADIEKCYGIIFDHTGIDISGYRLTARYIDEQLPDVIAVLQATLGLSIEFSGGNTYRLNSSEP